MDMTGRSKLFAALLAILMGLLIFSMAGCANFPGQGLTRTKDGRLEYPDGSNTWSWEKKSSIAQILLNGKQFAVVEKGQATISLPDGRVVDVMLDNKSVPLSLKVSWGTVIAQADYDLMNTAFKVHTLAGGVPVSSPWGWVLVQLVLVVVGVLVAIYAGSIVDSGKTGGIFSSFNTAKALLIIRAIGVLIAIVSIVGLIVTIAR
jgi:hypothetical protein